MEGAEFALRYDQADADWEKAIYEKGGQENIKDLYFSLDKAWDLAPESVRVDKDYYHAREEVITAQIPADRGNFQLSPELLTRTGAGTIHQTDPNGKILKALSVGITGGPGTLRARVAGVFEYGRAGPDGPPRFIRHEPEAFFENRMEISDQSSSDSAIPPTFSKENAEAKRPENEVHFKKISAGIDVETNSEKINFGNARIILGWAEWTAMNLDNPRRFPPNFWELVYANIPMDSRDDWFRFNKSFYLTAPVEGSMGGFDSPGILLAFSKEIAPSEETGKYATVYVLWRGTNNLTFSSSTVPLSFLENFTGIDILKRNGTYPAPKKSTKEARSSSSLVSMAAALAVLLCGGVWLIHKKRK